MERAVSSPFDRLPVNLRVAGVGLARTGAGIAGLGASWPVRQTFIYGLCCDRVCPQHGYPRANDPGVSMARGACAGFLDCPEPVV